MRDLLDVRQAAARTQRDPETIRRWIRDGRLTATRIGRRWMVEAEDVDALAKRGHGRLTLAEWYEKYMANLPPRRRRKGPSAGDLVVEERYRRGEELFDRYIRRRDRPEP